MAGRAYWKGYLKLSLVSCPVKLYPATNSSGGRISFNLLHKETQNRVQQKYFDPELGEVDRADLVKGYQFEKDKYVVITPEELDAIEIESSKTIDIEGFVPASEIDTVYFDNPYYLAPDGPVAQETYAVILEAMKRTGKVAVARLVLSGRERLVAIEPLDLGFRLTTLRSAKEVREPASALDPLAVKLAPDALSMAEQIITQREGHFHPQDFTDRYEEALLMLVRSKIAGGEPVIAKAPERGDVINLMDALRRSIEGERRPPAPSLAREEKPATQTRRASARGKAATAAPPEPAAEPTKSTASKSATKKPVAKKKAGGAS